MPGITTVQDNPQESRFEVYIDDELAGFADYRLSEGQIIFPYVRVFPHFEGKGVGSVLVRHALDTVRKDGTRTIVPICPFVQAMIRRYPEYQPLVDGPAG